MHVNQFEYQHLYAKVEKDSLKKLLIGFCKRSQYKIRKGRCILLLSCYGSQDIAMNLRYEELSHENKARSYWFTL